MPVRAPSLEKGTDDLRLLYWVTRGPGPPAENAAISVSYHTNVKVKND